MKRIVLCMLTVLLISSITMAQNGRQGSGERVVDPKTRAERMTERMVKEYSLNDEQKQQLLDANLVWVEKMVAVGERSNRQKDENAPKVSKEEREKKKAEMDKSREVYEAQLKKILTAEQYGAYVKKQAEREKRMKESRQERQRRQN